MKKIFFVAGGDLRQIYAAKKLSEKFDVCITGFDKNIIIPENIKIINNISDMPLKADYLLLPMPVSTDGINLNAPFGKETIPLKSVEFCTKDSTTVFGGKINENIKSIFRLPDSSVYDYLEREEYTIINAVSTAEGALQIALEEMPITIYDSDILITGWGRISKLLSKMLVALGANVTVSARKYSDLTWAKIYGCKTILISEMNNTAHKYDIVFNTVPAIVLGKAVLEKLNNDCLVVDLASKPGGIDFNVASSLGIKTIWALGLPGKSAPVSAGHMLADTIINILNERGELNE